MDTSDVQRTGQFPEVSPAAEAALERHNRHWRERQSLWLSQAAAPWWAPGQIVTPELRARYEAWLPLAEYLRTLRAVGRHFLPEHDWLPAALQHAPWSSLPDFWATLPHPFPAHLEFAPHELLSLFCALADPPRFGTNDGRYPRQRRLLECLLPDFAAAPLRILDIGCGIGLNTLETAQLAVELASSSRLEVTGITSEPLEVWMATQRRVPHDPSRERRFHAYRDLPVHVRFLHGFAEAFPADDSPSPKFPSEEQNNIKNLQVRDRFCAEKLPSEKKYDIILCNGLVGGRFFHRLEQYEALLQHIRHILAPRGAFLLANRFHDGARPAVEHFVQYASQHDFRVSGTWDCLCLS